MKNIATFTHVDFEKFVAIHELKKSEGWIGTLRYNGTDNVGDIEIEEPRYGTDEEFKDFMKKVTKIIYE